MSDSLCNSCGSGEHKTLNNILHAFLGETNASARYTAFAAKAKADGYPAVASLFSASAISEKIHAGRHARVAMFLGKKPEATPKPVEVADVVTMLTISYEDESEEATVMYPRFIEEAKAEEQRTAIVSFHGSMKTEIEHARLCKEALENLEEWKKARAFFVCAMCGWTTEGPRPSSCPVCSNADSGFLDF
ncbi:MAG: rubrerythrin family protein [Planctomycetia bacterium]|nr:rubrerythrin family protein [Planctomycetia bacterium]